jgi:hypothetical protein
MFPLAVEKISQGLLQWSDAAREGENIGQDLSVNSEARIVG